MSFGQAYLSLPDLFPARQSGEAWGETDLTLDLAGGPYRIENLSGPQAGALLSRFGSFASTVEVGAGSPLRIRVLRADRRDFLGREAGRSWRYSLDMSYEPRAVKVATYEFMGRLDWHSGLTAALWTPLERGPEFGRACENFFRVVVAYRLVEEGGALLHSAGVVDRNQAYLFLGRSGAGKTTVARLSLLAGRLVLSDDMNGLRRTAQGLLVEKLPFAGDLGGSTGSRTVHPLRRLLRLEKGDEISLRPLGAAESLSLLIACSPYVNADPHRMDQLTANLVALIREFPVAALTFTPDPTFWRLLESAI